MANILYKDATTGGMVLHPSELIGGFTTVANTTYYVNTTSNTVTATPHAPTIGDRIQFIDSRGTFGTNSLTIDTSGQLLNGGADDLVLDANNTSVILIYTGATRGWIIDGEVKSGPNIVQSLANTIRVAPTAAGSTTSATFTAIAGAIYTVAADVAGRVRIDLHASIANGNDDDRYAVFAIFKNGVAISDSYLNMWVRSTLNYRNDGTINFETTVATGDVIQLYVRHQSLTVSYGGPPTDSFPVAGYTYFTIQPLPSSVSIDPTLLTPVDLHMFSGNTGTNSVNYSGTLINLTTSTFLTKTDPKSLISPDGLGLTIKQAGTYRIYFGGRNDTFVVGSATWTIMKNGVGIAIGVQQLGGTSQTTPNASCEIIVDLIVGDVIAFNFAAGNSTMRHCSISLMQLPTTTAVLATNNVPFEQHSSDIGVGTAGVPVITGATQGGGVGQYLWQGNVSEVLIGKFKIHNMKFNHWEIDGAVTLNYAGIFTSITCVQITRAEAGIDNAIGCTNTSTTVVVDRNDAISGSSPFYLTVMGYEA